MCVAQTNSYLLRYVATELSILKCTQLKIESNIQERAWKNVVKDYGMIAKWFKSSIMWQHGRDTDQEKHKNLNPEIQPEQFNWNSNLLAGAFPYDR